MRLFVAIELPEAVREAAAIAGSRRDAWPAASWVRADNLHLTLVFLGEVDPATLAPLEAALRRHLAPLAPWRARLDGAGAFPPQGALRVVWVGVEPAAPFVALAAAVRAACREVGLAVEDRAFAPHLTLARCRPTWRASERERLAKLAPRQEAAFEVDAVAVIESELGAAGPRYRRQAAIRLGAAA